MPTDYCCNRWTRTLFVLMVVVFGGAFGAFYLGPAMRAPDASAAGQRLLIALPLGLLFGGMACAGLVGLATSFTTIRLDENGIIKRGWNGRSQQVAWRDLVSVESPKGASVKLTDVHGIRMALPHPELGYINHARRTLYDAVEAELASLPEGVKTRMEEPHTFRFGTDTGTIAAGFMSLLCTVLAFTMPLMPHSGPPAPAIALIGMSTFFLFGALFMAQLALRHATQVFTLTDTGLTDKNLFRTRFIPFDRAKSLTTKEETGRSGTIEWATIKSATNTIKFPSNLPDYDRLIQQLKGRLHGRVEVNAPQVIKEEMKQNRLQNVIGLGIIGVVFGIGVVGLALDLRHNGQDVLQRQRRLDISGVTTNGLVTEVGATGRNSMPFSLTYTFDVDGRRYSSISSVSRQASEQVNDGSAVRVTYLPNNPEVSRAAPSMAREDAEGKIRVSKIMIIAACGIPLLLMALSFATNVRYVRGGK